MAGHGARFLIQVAAAVAGLIVAVAGALKNASLWVPIGAAVLGFLPALAQVVIDELRRRRAEEAPGKEDTAAHFDPGGRGTEPGDSHGWYFTGRTVALQELGAWVADGSDTRTRVVTGAPGSGKSATLWRLWWLSDPEARQQLRKRESDLPQQLLL